MKTMSELWEIQDKKLRLISLYVMLEWACITGYSMRTFPDNVYIRENDQNGMLAAFD